VGTKKICTVQIPTVHGLLVLRDDYTFPVSQFKLEVALFGATFSLKLIVPDVETLLRRGCDKDQPEPLQACRDICIYNTFCGSLVFLRAPP
jgi:hypothetical protein